MTKRKYEAVIGLEVHAELKTRSKIFCACSTRYGAPPNTQCCPICMGHPGTLPSLNREAVLLAVRAGLALGCRINERSQMDRKHYFYPDLPKGYQISQDARPLCEDGGLLFDVGEEMRIAEIARVHLEEDAGKLIHRGGQTLIDHNRCGLPLIEIVTRPMLRSGAEAAAYLRALRAVLVRIGASDCRMEEGSMRCDVNVSVRPVNSCELGVRTEIKNVNSFAFVEKAINYEIERHVALLEAGERPVSETRRYDEVSAVTRAMRKKERAEEYYYLPEPNLPRILLTQEEIEQLRASIPELPRAMAKRLQASYGLSRENAATLASEPALAAYFEDAASGSSYPRLVANLLLSELLPHLSIDPFSSPVAAARLRALAELMGEGEITSATVKKLFQRLLRADFDPAEVVQRESLGVIRDRECLLREARLALLENPKAVADYQKGKQAALQALLGGVMRRTGGRAEPRLSEELLRLLLNGGGEG